MSTSRGRLPFKEMCREDGDGNMKRALILATLAVALAGNIRCAKEYPLAARVIDIQGDTVSLCDGAGNVWKWEGAEDWQIGDIAAMIMSDNGTSEISDDEILEMRYSALFG